MSITNYAELQTAVLGWSARADTTFTAKVPDFIRLGEERLWRELRINRMIEFTTLTVVAGQNWVALPTSWVEFDSLSFDDGGRTRKLEYRSYDWLIEQEESIGKFYYSIKGTRLVYGFTPTSDVDLDVTYFKRQDPLATTSTNWLLTDSPSVYLYAALLEGAVFAKNTAKAGEYGTLFDKAVAALEATDNTAKTSGSRLRAVAR